MENEQTNQRVSKRTKRFRYSEDQNGAVTLAGLVTVNDAKSFPYRKADGTSYSIVDLSQGEYIEEVIEEIRTVCLGYSHSGGVYCDRRVNAKYNSLQVLLEKLSAEVVILPPSVTRKQMNACMRNQRISQIHVTDDCKLFSMKDGNVWNKKGTILIHQQSGSKDNIESV